MKIQNIFLLEYLGTAQSPINVVTNDVVIEQNDIGDVITIGFDSELEGYLANTGRMLQFMNFGFFRPTIEGGPLGSKR